MSEQTRVYLLTGFLGSGKTTLLNRIIRRFPKNLKLMILMNEFGEIGVDGTLVERDGLEVLEISKGSIFCVCVKTDFIKGLYAIAQRILPDVLIIESTGVANPSALRRDLKLSVFKDRFQFAEQFCIIDAHHFLDVFDVYASPEKQIASSTIFVINKIDGASGKTVEQIKRVVRRFHSSPRFYETSYGRIPPDLFSFPDAGVQKAPQVVPPGDRLPHLSEEEWERFFDDLFDRIGSELTPPDCLISAAYRWTGNDLGRIEEMASRLSSSIVRAKGFLIHRGDRYLFNFVMNEWSLEKCELPSDRIHHENVLIFIGSPQSIAVIDDATATGEWVKLGVYQPSMQPM